MPQKVHFKCFQGGPQKKHFLTPKMSFPRFSNFDLCRGTLGSQGYFPPGETWFARRKRPFWDSRPRDTKSLPAFSLSIFGHFGHFSTCPRPAACASQYSPFCVAFTPALAPKDLTAFSSFHCTDPQFSSNLSRSQFAASSIRRFVSQGFPRSFTVNEYA